jgi:hypothetical protein
MITYMPKPNKPAIVGLYLYMKGAISVLAPAFHSELWG